MDAGTVTKQREAVVCPNCGKPLGITREAGQGWLGDVEVARAQLVCACGRVFHWHSENARRRQ